MLNQAFFIQFVPANNINVNTIGITLGSNVAAAFASLAIYSDNAGSCNALVAQTTPFSIASGATLPIYAALTSQVNLTAGSTYWMGFTADTSGFSWYADGSGTMTGRIINQTSHARNGNGANASTLTGASLAFPSTCGATNAGTEATLPQVVLFP